MTGSGADVVVHMGDVEEDGGWAADLQERLGLPVVVFSDEMTQLEQVYTMLGEVTSDEDAAEERASYVRDMLVDVPKGPNDGDTEQEEEESVRVYIGVGADSLETPAGGGQEVVALAGGVNAVESTSQDPNETVSVSLAELIELDPGVILVCGTPEESISGQDAVWRILDNPAFGTMTAVQDERVFGVPAAPFSWIGAPNTPNRLVGFQWVRMLLYPEQYDTAASLALRKNVREFYRLFYGLELSDGDLDELAYLPVIEEETEGGEE